MSISQLAYDCIKRELGIMVEKIATIQSQLAASQERERILRKGLREYASADNWVRTEIDCQYRNLWMRWENGYDIAKRTIKAAKKEG